VAMCGNEVPNFVYYHCGKKIEKLYQATVDFPTICTNSDPIIFKISVTHYYICQNIFNGLLSIKKGLKNYFLIQAKIYNESKIMN
jgi:hypothetical protein